MKQKLLILITTLFLFGHSTQAQTNIPCTYIKISAGSDHTVAIKGDGTLWAWGRNDYGQLGDGTLIMRNTPIQIGIATNWSDISAGQSFAIATKTDGTLWAWGRNDIGQLGDGTLMNKNMPTQIGTATNCSKISAGDFYAMATKTDGTLWAWGWNAQGQLGDGTTIHKNIPTQIGNGTNWSTISAGHYHSIATRSDGTLWAWGHNAYGLLGNGTTSNIIINIPTQIGTATNWSNIDIGYLHTLAIRTDGTLWAWGRNTQGQLGDGTTIDKNTPTQIGNSTNWSTISGGQFHSIATRSDGTLWTWGNNLYGQLGDGTNSPKYVPTQIGTATNWSKVSAKAGQTAATITDGTLWAWGRNGFGQLGVGTYFNKNVPTTVFCNTVTPLSVRFLGFTVSEVGAQARLDWSTATEENNQFFNVQHSSNGTDFVSINQLPSKAIYGSSAHTLTYQSTHHNPTMGRNYYRIEQVDYDNTTSYSAIKSLVWNGGTISTYPNPVRDVLTVEMNSTANAQTEIKLVDISGRVVRSIQAKTQKGQKNIKVPTAELAQGMYILKIYTNNKLTNSTKIYKQTN